MFFKVKTLFWLRLPHAGMAVGFITIIASFLNIVDLIDHLINFEDRKPSYHVLVLSPASVAVIKWEIVGYFLLLLTGVFLIIGTIKKSYRLLLPWLILTVYGILYGTGMTIFFSIFSISESDNPYGQLFVFIVLGMLFLTGLGIYIWIGILSLYRKIRDKKLAALAEAAAIAEAESLYPNGEPNVTIKPSCLQQSPERTSIKIY